jgi:hypothetical protein
MRELANANKAIFGPAEGQAAKVIASMVNEFNRIDNNSKSSNIWLNVSTDNGVATNFSIDLGKFKSYLDDMKLLVSQSEKFQFELYQKLNLDPKNFPNVDALQIQKISQIPIQPLQRFNRYEGQLEAALKTMLKDDIKAYKVKNDLELDGDFSFKKFIDERMRQSTNVDPSPLKEVIAAYGMIRAELENKFQSKVTMGNAINAPQASLKQNVLQKIISKITDVFKFKATKKETTKANGVTIKTDRNSSTVSMMGGMGVTKNTAAAAKQKNDVQNQAVVENTKTENKSKNNVVPDSPAVNYPDSGKKVSKGFSK